LQKSQPVFPEGAYGGKWSSIMSQEKALLEFVPIDEVPPPDSSEGHRPVVLIVDDEEMIADTLGIILSHQGFAPLTAYDAESALEIANVIPPEVLLTDIVMPGMNGIELAIEMTRLVPDCKILLFSGQSARMEDMLEEARAEGHDFEALTKPIHPTVLVQRITHCLKA
jgi:DNA-binding response OmpR family regulator